MLAAGIKRLALFPRRNAIGKLAQNSEWRHLLIERRFQDEAACRARSRRLACATPQDMTIETFKAALLHDNPPAGWSLALQALWHQGKGYWDRAHQLAQSRDSPEAAWAHAHLHRAEGDAANASYWYRRAGREPSTAPLDRELAAIAAALLAAAAEPGERR